MEKTCQYPLFVYNHELMKRCGADKKSVILLWGICLLVLFLASAGFSPLHDGHDCPGEGCPACILLQITGNMPRNAVFILSLGLVGARTGLALQGRRPYGVPLGGMNLKVRFNI
jgi:hypothetical protein